MEPMVFWDTREVRGWGIISHKALIPMGEWCGWERYQKQLWNTTGVEKRKRYSHFRKQQEEWFRTWYGVFTTEKCKYFCDRRYFVIDKSLLMGEPAWDVGAENLQPLPVGRTSVPACHHNVDRPSCTLKQSGLRCYATHPACCYFLTLSVIVSSISSQVNDTVAFPFVFLALILNLAWPLASVLVLLGDTDTYFLPDLSIFASTISPSTRQPQQPECAAQLASI